MYVDEQITFAGEGDEVSPGHAQDIVFVVKEKPHSHFTRDGHDLIFKYTVALADALAGFQVTVMLVCMWLKLALPSCQGHTDM